MIRSASESDVPEIMKLVEAAKSIMRSSGNLDQWANGYPDKSVILKDIAGGFGRMVEAESGSSPCGYFAFIPSPEPTYSEIEGKWLDDTRPYHVIHRIASTAGSHGVFDEIIRYAFSNDDNIRIDTHRDNKIMQHVILKAGFTYCGIIHLASGSERLAYQKFLNADYFDFANSGLR